MALSLLCKQCNTLLASVAEAQNHSDVTGHVQFEESTQAIKREVCTVCGKPCRSEAEKKLHSRNNPGHDEYVEKTEEASALDTEAQMAQAKLSAQEELDADAELLGVKRKKPAAAAAGAGAAPAAAAGGGGAGTSGEGGAEGMDVDEEKVPVEVNEQMLGELTAMGFGVNRATRALHAAGNSSVEGAINWLSEHDNDADIDEPLLIPKSQFKKPLSAEEARAKAEELVRRAKEKREAEERELEKHRERERIRAGKELQEAKRKEEEGRLQRIAEERARQKAEDARAREALRAKLEEDRKERRRKLGLPEELTEEEKAREAEKLRKRAAEEAAKHQVYIKPISVLDKLRSQLVALKKGAPSEDAFKTAATTLGKYIANVLRSPDEEKFRRVNMGNAAFQARVGGAGPGGVEVLETVGFQREADGTTLFMAREKADAEVLNTACAALSDAITNPFFGAL